MEPHNLCKVLMKCLKSHPVLELTSADRDHVLRGLLQVTAAILTTLAATASRHGIAGSRGSLVTRGDQAMCGSLTDHPA